jgi:hypothetical protein
LLAGGPVAADQIVHAIAFEPFVVFNDGGCMFDGQTFTSCSEQFAWLGYVALPAFDASLGELEAVEFRLRLTGDVSVAISDFGPPTGTTSIDIAFRVFRTSGPGLPAEEVAAALAAGFAQAECAPPCTLRFPIELEVDKVFAGPLESFIGAGDLAFLYEGDLSIEASGAYDGASSMPEVGFTATYEYTPLPEPGTGLLALLGLAAGVRARRRARRC